MSTLSAGCLRYSLLALAGPYVSWALAAQEGVSSEWAAVYDFFIERERLNRPFGWLLFGTDTQLLYRAIAAIAEVPDGGERR